MYNGHTRKLRLTCEDPRTVRFFQQQHNTKRNMAHISLILARSLRPRFLTIESHFASEGVPHFLPVNSVPASSLPGGFAQSCRVPSAALLVLVPQRVPYSVPDLCSC